MKKFSVNENNLHKQYIPCGVDYLLNKIKEEKPIIFHKRIIEEDSIIGYDHYSTSIKINGFKYSVRLEKHLPLLPPIMIINHYQLRHKNSEFLKVFKSLPITDDNSFGVFYNIIPESKFSSFLEYLNEYKALIGNTIYFDKLKDVLYMIDLEDEFNFDILKSNLLKSGFKVID